MASLVILFERATHQDEFGRLARSRPCPERHLSAEKFTTTRLAACGWSEAEPPEADGSGTIPQRTQRALARGHARRPGSTVKTPDGRPRFAADPGPTLPDSVRASEEAHGTPRRRSQRVTWAKLPGAEPSTASTARVEGRTRPAGKAPHRDSSRGNSPSRRPLSCSAS